VSCRSFSGTPDFVGALGRGSRLAGQSHGRPRRLLVVALGVMALALAWASPSWATSDVISASAPAAATVNAGATTVIPGASVTDSTNPGQTQLVSISTTLGSLSLAQTSGLTLSYGYSTFSGPSFSFTATSADANAALATLALTGTGTPGPATISISTTANQTGVAYEAANQHYYQFVPTANIQWTAAQTAANQLLFDGQEGYLAAVPNQGIKDFVDAHLNGALNVWAGGMSVDYPSGNGPDGSHRAWSWFGQPTPGTANYGGPLAGTTFTECTTVSGYCTFLNTNAFFQSTWNDSFGLQEPNNSGYSSGTPGSGEHYLEVNYSANPGTWNDIANTNAVAGYVVEYGDQAVGASSYSGQATATATVTTALAPGAPTGVTVSAVTGGQATVSWIAPADGGSPITGYLASATSAGVATRSCATTTQTTCTITGLAGGVVYAFSVTATNGLGGEASPPTSGLVPPTVTATASPASACPAASGAFTATSLGGITVGMTRKAARTDLTGVRATTSGWERLCLSVGGSSRFAYATPRLLAHLSPALRTKTRDRIVIVLTANPRFSWNGIHPGSTLAAARSKLALTRPIRIGTNRWYFISGRNGLRVLKVHTGHVGEFGVIFKGVASTPAAQRVLLHSLNSTIAAK
jgi:hypothetical protein